MDPAPLPEWIKEILKPRQRETPAGEVAVHRLATGNTPYGVAALERHAREIRQAPEGARNDTLNVAAFALAQLVAGGELVASDTRWELEQAAVDAGLGRQEARGTIDSGMTAGMKEPRSAPHRDIEPPTIDIPRIKVARL
jgi:hypothetical protein